MFFRCISSPQIYTASPGEGSQSPDGPTRRKSTIDCVKRVSVQQQVISSQETATSFNSGESCRKRARLTPHDITTIYSEINIHHQRVKVTYNRKKANEQIEEGNFSEGLLHGVGSITWPNRSSTNTKPHQVFSGIFMDGQLVRGTIKLEDGTIEKGAFDKMEVLDGDGTRIYPDGILHLGFFVEGKLQNGKKISPSDLAYEVGFFDQYDSMTNGKRVFLNSNQVEVYKDKKLIKTREMNLIEIYFEKKKVLNQIQTAASEGTIGNS